MNKISKQELFVEFGFHRNPFRGIRLNTTDHQRIGKVINMAIEDHAMISVVGERGIGKSCSVRTALSNNNNITVITPQSNDMEKLYVSDIEQAIIFDLSREKPKRGKEIRARQLRRIIGSASSTSNIVLVIEEAHHLHGNTLRSLKRMREIQWKGEVELLSIILVGQSNPMNKAGVSEVRLRSDCITMHGLTKNEASVFIKTTVGSVFTKEAIDTLSKSKAHHNYEDLKGLIIAGLESALFAGRREVLECDVLPQKRKSINPSSSRAATQKATKRESPEAHSVNANGNKDCLSRFLEQDKNGTDQSHHQVAI